MFKRLLARLPSEPGRTWLLLGLCLLLGLIGAIGVNPNMVPGMSHLTPTAAGSPPVAISGQQQNSPGANGMPTPAQFATTPVATAQAGMLAYDTFARPSQSLWGVASSGKGWQADAAINPSFLIQNGEGVVRNGQQNETYNALIGPIVGDATVVFSGTMSNFQGANLGGVLRWQDNNNWYKAYFDGTDLAFKKSVNGNVTLLAQAPFEAQANVNYTLRFHIAGNMLQARLWRTDQPEPLSWMLTFADPAHDLSQGMAGIRLVMTAGTEVRITGFTEVGQ